MSITATVITSNLAKGASFGYDNQGRLIASVSYLVKLTGVVSTSSVVDKITAVLGASGVPTKGALLTTGNASNTNPYAMQIIAKPYTDDEPHVFVVEVTYGYWDVNGVSQDDDTGDEPDVDRERYPWEENAVIDIDIGNSREAVPEGGMYHGCLSLVSVIAEKGTAGAIPTSGGTYQPIKNTAGDPFKDPPLKVMRSGSINISFAVVEAKTEYRDWRTTSFLNNYLFKVNSAPFTIGSDVAQSVTGTFVVPAGTCQVIGFSCVSKTYTETRKWRPGKPHPFGKKVSLTVMTNRTKTELTATRYTPYYDVTIKMEYREDGYIHYIQNMGMRELKTVPVPAVWANGAYSSAGNAVVLQPIRTPTMENVTEPWRLSTEGVALPIDAADIYFQKYVYYGYTEFSGTGKFINAIPWIGIPVVLEDPE